VAEEPIDALSVSTYKYSLKAFGTEKNMAQLTREVTTLPLMIYGSIYDRTSADDALNDVYIILSGKSMLLNPNEVEDIRANKELNRHLSEEADIAYTSEPLL